MNRWVREYLYANGYESNRREDRLRITHSSDGYVRAKGTFKSLRLEINFLFPFSFAAAAAVATMESRERSR